MRKEWDVVVIGAGPSGSTTARVLAEHGKNVLLLERGAYPGEKVVCGGGMPYALVRKLKLDDNIHQKITTLFLKTTKTEMLYQNEKPVLGAISRKKLDGILAERATRAGACLKTKRVVKKVDRIPGKGFSLEILHLPTDEHYQITTRSVVFADGVPTLAQRDLGIGFDPSSQLCAYALKYNISPCSVIPPAKFDFILDYQKNLLGYIWIFPKKDYINVGIGALVQEKKGELDTLLREELLKRGIDLSRTRIFHRRGGLIPLEAARLWYTHGALVVGDAAGCVNSLTGGGLVYAIRSGEVAGRVLAHALSKNDVCAKQLRVYQKIFMRSRHGIWLKMMNFLVRSIWRFHHRWPRGYEKMFEIYFRLNPLFVRIRRI